MSFYDYNTQQINEELLPPELRQPKHRAWLKVLLTPLQYFRDLFFDSYIDSVNVPVWDSSTTFFPGVRTIYFDNSVYECVQTNSNTIPNSAPIYWRKIQDVYIGVTERLQYNSQIIIFEYALNKWFRNIGATDQIYIVTNQTESDFFQMAESEVLSSSMSMLDLYATEFMGVSFTALTQYDYTIMVPAVLFASLATLPSDSENIIRNIVNKYNMAGMQYSVDTF